MRRHVSKVPEADVRRASESRETAVNGVGDTLRFGARASALHGENAREGARWKDRVRDRCRVSNGLEIAAAFAQAGAKVMFCELKRLCPRRSSSGDSRTSMSTA